MDKKYFLLSFKVTFCWLILVGHLVALQVQAAQLQSVIPFPDGLELHSDDPSLIENYNSSNTHSTASVDTVRLIMQQLGWVVKLHNVPLTRSFDYMEKGKPVCVVNKIKTPERAKRYVFSLPINFFEPQRFYQLAELPPIPAAFLNEQGEIKSIHALMNSQPEATILKPRNFSFGHKVDADLAQVNQQQIIPIANEGYYASSVKMFASRRTDYAVVFPLALYQSYGDALPVEVRSYPIAGNPRYVSGHFLCDDSAQSKQLIAAVNDIIKTLYSSPEYIQAHTRYLPKQSGETIASIIRQQAQELEYYSSNDAN